MQITTYTQEQLNSVTISYMQEIQRLVEMKANKDLAILNLKTQNQQLQKEIAELKSKVQE